MNIVFCGGGTSGHIMPAIAIAEKFREEDPNSKITFIVRRDGKENEILKKQNVNIKEIDISGLKRKLTLENIKRIRLALSALKESKKILKEISPDCIIGTGGYVCWPVIMAGNSLKIPTYIHESNIYPGLVTKLLSTKCNKIFLSSEETMRYLSHKGVYSVVGTPLLRSYQKSNREGSRKELGLKANERLIVSFGGSIGAEKINDTIIEIMKSYSSSEKNIKHIHSTGQRLYDSAVKSWTPPVSSGCILTPYIDNMPTLLNAADLVICRAGAMTISEISAVGAPSIVIPSPHVANNHQYKNAKILSDKSSIILLEEKDLTKDNLLQKIKEVIENDGLRKSLSRKIKVRNAIDASEIIYKEIAKSQKI